MVRDGKNIYIWVGRRGAHVQDSRQHCALLRDRNGRDPVPFDMSTSVSIIPGTDKRTMASIAALSDSSFHRMSFWITRVIVRRTSAFLHSPFLGPEVTFSVILTTWATSPGIEVIVTPPPFNFVHSFAALYTAVERRMSSSILDPLEP